MITILIIMYYAGYEYKVHTIYQKQESCFKWSINHNLLYYIKSGDEMLMWMQMQMQMQMLILMGMLIVNSQAFTTKSEIWAYVIDDIIWLYILLILMPMLMRMWMLILMLFLGNSRDQQMESESETWNDLFAISIRNHNRIRNRIHISSPDIHRMLWFFSIAASTRIPRRREHLNSKNIKLISSKFDMWVELPPPPPPRCNLLLKFDNLRALELLHSQPNDTLYPPNLWNAISHSPWLIVRLFWNWGKISEATCKKLSMMHNGHGI